MVPNFNTISPSHDSNQPQTSVIPMQELHSILKAWARNPSTNVSRSEGTEIAKKILVFYTMETNSKYTNQRNQSLEITGVQAKSFPDIFSYAPFTRITNLKLQMGLSELPRSINQLKGLKSLNVSHNNLDHLPENLSELSQLVDLNVSHNRLYQIPENLHQLDCLQKLDLSFNRVTEIPNNLDRLEYLTNLNLACNQLSNLPESFSQCKFLTHLDLSSNNFSSIPKALTRIRQIKELNVRENSLTSLPDISEWKELVRLDLGDNKFTDWPKSLEELSEHAVVMLDSNFSAWKTAKILSKIERKNYQGPQIRCLEEFDSSDSESEISSNSDEESFQKPMSASHTVYDRIEFPSNSSPSENIRKRKADKFLEQSEIARKVLKRNPPSTISDDFGASYSIFSEVKDKTIGVYKPRLQVMRAGVDYDSDEGEIDGIPIGTEAFRERLAYALSYELSQTLDENDIPLKDFGVPPTRIMDYKHKLFGRYHKTGSMQKFKKNCVDLRDETKAKFEQIDRNELFKIAVLDLIFLNKDRNPENLLYSERKNTINLIDHGYCFPEVNGLESLDLSWKSLSFIHETIPKNWINFILQIDLQKLVDRTVQEIDLHTKKFPNEDMQISGESLFAMLYGIESLRKFVQTNVESPTISKYLNHLLSYFNFSYVQIKDLSGSTHYVHFPEELPMFYTQSDSEGKHIPQKFNQHSFDCMGFDIFSGEQKAPLPGELRLQQMCEQHGFENITLYKKQFMESQFSKELKEAFLEYKRDKELITPHFIQQSLNETKAYITSFLAKHPIRSFEDLLREELKEH